MWRMFLDLKETKTPNTFVWQKYWVVIHQDGRGSLISRKIKTPENLKVYSLKELTSKMEQVWQKHQSKSEVEA